MVRRTIMSDHPVVMAVATYRSKAAAQQDFDGVASEKYERELVHVAAALLEKGADGALMMDRHDSAATTVAWDGVVLGAALTVITAQRPAQPYAAVGAAGRTRQRLSTRPAVSPRTDAYRRAPEPCRRRSDQDRRSPAPTAARLMR
jgi:hypothetical protein